MKAFGFLAHTIPYVRGEYPSVLTENNVDYMYTIKVKICFEGDLTLTRINPYSLLIGAMNEGKMVIMISLNQIQSTLNPYPAGTESD